MLTTAIALVPGATDEPPEAEDVTAGTWGLVMFVLLVLAVVILMRSFLKQMRKTDEAKRAGVFGDEPESPSAAEDERPDNR